MQIVNYIDNLHEPPVFTLSRLLDLHLYRLIVQHRLISIMVFSGIPCTSCA